MKFRLKFLNVDVKLFQHYLLKRLYLLFFFQHLCQKIYVCVLIFVLSIYILFYLSVCPAFHQYYTILTTIALYFNFFFSCGIEVWTQGFKLRASCLWGKCSTAWALPPALVARVIFETGSHFLPRPQSSYFKLPTVAGMMGKTCHHTWLFSTEMGSHKHFCPGWPETMILSTSAS
jgi:hypothetical protein